MSTSVKNRFKSFAWRAGMMILSFTVDQILENLTSFNIPKEYVVIAGLILGEISKYISAEIQYRKELEQI